jgi:hypothetical protein
MVWEKAKAEKMFMRTLFGLTRLFPFSIRFFMSAIKARWCWRKDLSAFRGMSDRERAGFLLVLEWAVFARATPGQVDEFPAAP